MKIPTTHFFILLILLYFVGIATSSMGDRASDFQSRVKICKEECIQDPTKQPSLYLRTLLWDCLDNCKYIVMREITVERRELGLEVYQYHGKWPFIRVFGIQEPASVLFSIMNLLMYIYCFKKYLRETHPDYKLRKLWVGYTLIAFNAWICSSIFHTRDLLVTERLDYFGATLSVFYGVVCAVTRVMNLRKEPAIAFGLLMLILLVVHVGYLNFVDFDYGWNMTVTASMGVLSNIIWIGWSIKTKRKYCWKGVTAILLVSTFMLLELGDFQPIYDILDAHSIWHLSTVPLIYVWYSFLIDDANYETFRPKIH